MKTVVVTGVSTGIGLATACLLAQRGMQVFGSVRRPGDAEPARAECGGNFTPLIFDITDPAAIAEAVREVRERLSGERLFGLVNNAGVAVPGPTLELSVTDFRHQVDVNLTGAFAVTKGFLPLLGTDHELIGRAGRIVNVSSVGGRRGLPFMGAYVASKFALEGWSECLRRELMLYGIDVIVVAPGSVATPIWDKAEAIDLKPYAASDYYPALLKFRTQMLRDGRKGYPPERVAVVIWTALTARRPGTRYAVVPRRLLNWTLPGILPARLLDRIIGAFLGLRAPSSHAWR
jgi:NAD(P)-dependent dehydrogenase (short-subunit alcohol dehydrogenase family)